MILVEATKENRMNGIFSYQYIYGYKEDPSTVDPLKVFKASSNIYTLYHHEAMRDPDRKQSTKQ